MIQLVPCPHCGRHLRVSEPRCPFCASEVDFSHVAPPRLPKTRLNRAALFAFGATLVGAACAGESLDQNDDGSADGGSSNLGGSAPVGGSVVAGRGGAGGTSAGVGGSAGRPATGGRGGLGGSGDVGGDGNIGGLYGGAPPDPDGGTGGFAGDLGGFGPEYGGAPGG